MTYPLLPDLPGFSIEHVTIADGFVLVQARSRVTRSVCPDCAQLSSSIYSRYQRTLADLPWSGRMVRLIIQVSRFFCKYPGALEKRLPNPLQHWLNVLHVEPSDSKRRLSILVWLRGENEALV